MFDINKDNRMDLKEKLLYNIWQELTKLNENKESEKVGKSNTTSKRNKKSSNG